MRFLIVAILATVTLGGCVDVVTDEDLVTESAAITAPPGTHAVTLIERRSFWDYYDRGAGVDATWKASPSCSYDNCFIGGQAPLGFGESYLATTISSGRTTTYFRLPFYVPAGAVRALVLRVMYDDGFVFYLNGKEGGRAAMPSGAVTYTTLSTGHEAENRYVEFDVSAQSSRLRPGEINWIAFEVHQASASSSDLVFDAELIAYSEGPVDDTTIEGIPANSVWHYWDRPSVSPAWKTAAYDDTAWSSGEGALGFGETYLRTQTASGQVTTYFRKHFTRNGSVEALLADVMYDDGFVAYLNGNEIARVSMPSGTVGPSTLALGHEAAGYQRFDWTSALGYLQDGVNVLAVEVHQNAASSSDLVFDLALTLDSPWDRQASGTTNWLNDVWMLDAQRGSVIGSNGTIRRTVDGGAHWTGVASGTTAPLYAIEFADDQHGWIGGADGTLLATTDGGASWHAQASPTTGYVFGMSFVSPTTGWITSGEPWCEDPGCASDGIYRTDDGGATWVRQATGAVTPYLIDFADDQIGYVVGYTQMDGKLVVKTIDGGATWAEVFVYPDAFNRIGSDLEVVDANTVWLVGYSTPHDDSGEVKRVTRDGGLTWTEAPRTSNGVGIDSIDFIDALHGWAIGAGGSIIATEDGGYTWEVQQVPRFADIGRPAGEAPYWAAIQFADADHGWIVGSHFPDTGQGAILATDTGGW